jgi:hypothetical protein
MNTDYIMTIVIDILCSLILFLAFIYSLFILFNHQFHHHNNMFILNICLNIISACIYFIIYFTMYYFNISLLYASNTCNLMLYGYLIAGIQIPFSFVTFSIHRYCSIVHYANPFFKTKRWVGICIASQWIGVCVISLPYALRKQLVSIC